MIKRAEKTTSSIVADFLIVLVALSAVSIYYYGLRALFIILASVGASIVSDCVCIRLRGATIDYKDMSGIISGIVLALMLPASINYYMAAGLAAFSVIVGKQIFGGHGCEIFSVPAVGFVFGSVCFPESVLAYVKPFTELPAFTAEVDVETVQSLSRTLMQNSTSSMSPLDLFLGLFAGPIGATHIIFLTVCAAVLIARRSVSALSFFTTAIVCFGYAYLFTPYGESGFAAMGYEAVSGMLVFGLLFLAGDFTTAPQTRSARFLYGLILALLIILFSAVGKCENPIAFAVLISNPICIELNRSHISFRRYYRLLRRRLAARKSAKEAHV